VVCALLKPKHKIEINTSSSFLIFLERDMLFYSFY
jgi:hypothetical protein